MNRINQPGFSLVEVMMALGILAIGGLAYAYFMANHQGGTEIGSKRRVQAHQIMNTLATSLTARDYESIKNLCTNKGAFTATGRTGLCSIPGPDGTQVLNKTALISENSNDAARKSGVEVLRSWDGLIDNAGTVCVDLYRCEEFSESMSLKVELKVFWTVNDALFSSAPVAITRGRW